MSNFFGEIYCWFESLFGLYLAEYLWGYNCNTALYDNPNIFNQVGLITIIVSLLIVLLYYYGINHPRFNRWKSWLLVLVISGIIHFFIAYGWSITHYMNGIIGDCLMFTRDADGTIISQLIYESNCIMFGVANFIVSTLWFILFSFILKWWSHNAKHSPCF
jgi:arginine exporter protein ArgO